MVKQNSEDGENGDDDENWIEWENKKVTGGEVKEK